MPDTEFPNTETEVKPATAAAADAAPENEDAMLAQLQGDLDRFKDLALRTQADFENFRKRAAREKEDAVKYANASFLEKLLPVFDNFELGLQAAKAEGENSPVFQGMQMVARQLQQFLQDQGVQSIDATGQPFDPNVHEALAQEPSTEVQEGFVVRQLRKGYKLKERLLRAANVIVSRGKE